MGASSRLLIPVSLVALLHAIAPKPPSWALWSVKVNVPSDVTFHKTSRGGDSGWGVDLKFNNRSVEASIWDDDGDAFFVIKRGRAFCQVSVGSNGLGPGVMIEVFKQHGLDCSVASGAGGPKDYAVSLSVDTTPNSSVDCDSTSTYNATHPCSTAKTWDAPKSRAHIRGIAAKPPSWTLWAVKIALPNDVIVRKVSRGGDSGWGVDLKFNNHTVEASIWDDDGDVFFVVKRGHAFCQVSVGSNGLGPGAMIEVFKQRGLNCSVASSAGGSKDYAVSLSVDTTLDSSADCDSTDCPDGACPSSTSDVLCKKTWHAPSKNLAKNSRFNGVVLKTRSHAPSILFV